MKNGRSVKKPAFAALCLVLLATLALAESAHSQGPTAGKGDHVLRGGVGGSGSQKGSDANKGADGSENHGAADPLAASAGGGGAGSGGNSDGTVARLADVVGDIFGAGGPNPGRGNSGVHGAPGPVAGAGLPVVGVAYGLYWLIRRRQNG
jgi:hypothetical protein